MKNMNTKFILAVAAAACVCPGSAFCAEVKLFPPALLAPEKPLYPKDMVNVEALCYLDAIDDVITVFQSIAFDVHNLSAFSEAVRGAGGASWAKRVLDIGTGSGAVGFLMLGHGAGVVVGTDIDPLAVKNAAYNARKLGFRHRFEARLVPETDPGAYSVAKAGERFDLVVSDPPQMYLEEEARLYPSEKDRRNYFRFDPGARLLSSLAAGLGERLAPGGRAWISLRSPAAKIYIRELAAKHDLALRVVFSGKDGVDYSAVRFLPPMPYKDPAFYDGKQRLLDVEVVELKLKPGDKAAR